MDRIKLRRALAATDMALVCAVPLAAVADDEPSAERTIDAMNQLWGRHAGVRANRAKGVVVEGSFLASGAGAGRRCR
jgi:catalase